MRGLTFTPDGRFLLVDHGSMLKLYTSDGGELAGGESGDILNFGRISATTPEGHLVASEELCILNTDSHRVASFIPAAPFSGRRLLAIEPLRMGCALFAHDVGYSTIVPLRTAAVTRSMGRNVNWAAFSPDGTLLAHDEPSDLISRDTKRHGRVVFRHAPSWEAAGQATFESITDPREVRFAPDGGHLLIVSDRRLIAVDLDPHGPVGEAVPAWRFRDVVLKGEIAHHALSADGRVVAVVTRDQPTIVRAWRFIGD